MARMMLQDPVNADAAFRSALLGRDIDAAQEILHEQYALVLVHPEAARMERDEWLRLLPDYLVEHFTDLHSQWDIDDELAVHLHLVEMSASVLGADRSGLFAITDTWLRTPVGWKVRLRHSTPLSAGVLPRQPAA